MTDVVKALVPLVQIATEAVRVPTSAKKTEVGRPSAQQVPQWSHRT